MKERKIDKEAYYKKKIYSIHEEDRTQSLEIIL
jgi:hypothetical protein